MKNKPVVKKCPKCRKLYTLGVNGVVGGCDKCMSQRRDKNGYAWGNGESTAEYIEVGTGERSTVNWEDVKP